MSRFSAFPTLFAIKSSVSFLNQPILLTANHSAPCPYLCA